MNRTIEPDGSITLRAGDCAFRFRRDVPGIVDVAITGIDDGQFGTATLDELRLALMRERPLELFMDVREAFSPAVGVSRDWTRFFAENRAQLKRVHVLVGSKVVELTIAIAQHLSRTGNLIQIYSDPESFERQRSFAISRVRGERA
jgi:hypothetical protein